MQKKPESFSVVVTSYNYKTLVSKAVDSALAQSCPPFEVVVVDDGSTDGSAELLQQRYGAHPLVKLILGTNHGQLASFIRAIPACSGDVICFLDADDYWDADYLQLLKEKYSSNPRVDCILANLKFTGQRRGRWNDDGADRDWGLTVLWTYMKTAWIGVPTSGLSARSEICRQVLSLPLEYQRDWRLRADDCLVYGVSLLGGRKLYVGDARANYHVHNSNQWLARTQDEAASLRRNLAIHRLFRHYLGEASRFLFPPMTALLEFKTKPTPTPDELRFYLWMALRAQAPLLMRLRQALSMLRYYRRANRRQTS